MTTASSNASWVNKKTAPSVKLSDKHALKTMKRDCYELSSVHEHAFRRCVLVFAENGVPRSDRRDAATKDINLNVEVTKYTKTTVINYGKLILWSRDLESVRYRCTRKVHLEEQVMVKAPLVCFSWHLIQFPHAQVVKHP